MIKLVSIILCSLLSVSIGFASKPFLSNSKLNISLNNFLALTCDPPGNLCVAVGRDNNFEDPSLLVYRSEDGGLTWGTPVSLSKIPKSVNSDPGLATDIKCDAAFQRCFITSSTQIGKEPLLLVYKTLGEETSWSEPIVLPLPKSKFEKNGNYIYASLSCSYSAFACVIAGSLRVGTKSTPLIYTTQDAGAKWTIGPTLQKPTGCVSNGISLYDVHCDNSGFYCKAVGYALTHNSLWNDYITSKPIVYLTEDGGRHWSKPSVLPTDIEKNKKASTLTNVKCDRTGQLCLAIGETVDFDTETSRFFSFNSTDGGAHWKNKQWINSDYSLEVFNAFDCDDTMINCDIVGYSRKSLTLRATLYSTANNAQTWEKDTSQIFPPFSYFMDIFCSDNSERCIAVGIHEEVNAMVSPRTLNSNKFLPKIPKPTISLKE